MPERSRYITEWPASHEWDNREQSHRHGYMWRAENSEASARRKKWSSSVKEKLLGRASQHPIPPPPQWVNSDGLSINHRKHMKSWGCGEGRIDVYLSTCIIGYGFFFPSQRSNQWSAVYVTGNESNTFPNLKTGLIMTIYWKGKVVFDYKWLCNRRRYSKIPWLKDVC